MILYIHFYMNEKTEIQESLTYSNVLMQRKMTSSRARRPWVKPMKVSLLTKEECTNLHHVRTRENLST
jgi:hypothetical protein